MNLECRKKLFLLLVFLLSLESIGSICFAEYHPVILEYERKKDRYHLVTRDARYCHLLEADVNSFLKWSKFQGESSPGQTPLNLNCDRHDATQKFDISTLIPERARTLLTKRNQKYHGPNCFNSALYVAQLQHHVRYTSENEWLYLIEKNCRALNKGELPRPGDVGVERQHDPLRSDSHGFIFVGNFIFQKASFFKEYEYELDQASRIFYRYNIDCQNVSGKPTKAECPQGFINFYRCEKSFSQNEKTQLLDELFSQALDEKSENLPRAIENISAVLSQFEKIPSDEGRLKCLLPDYTEVFNFGYSDESVLKSSKDSKVDYLPRYSKVSYDFQLHCLKEALESKTSE